MSLQLHEELHQDNEAIRLRLLAGAKSLVDTVSENPDVQFGDLSVAVTPNDGVIFRNGDLDTSQMLGIEKIDGAPGYHIVTVTRNYHQDGRFDLIRQVSDVKPDEYNPEATIQYYDDPVTPLLPPKPTTPHSEAYLSTLIEEVKSLEGTEPIVRPIKNQSRGVIARWLRRKNVAS